jgi:uncharacterized membrane protein YjfL (UPF0719 family)
MEILDNFLASFFYILVSFFLFFLGKYMYQVLHKEINVSEELVEKDNVAFAVAYVGFFVGLIMIIGVTLSGESHGILEDVIDMLIYGILGIVLLNFSLFINDKIIFSQFKFSDEILRDKNIGSGVIEFANSVSVGLVLYGAISGEGGSVFTAVAFWFFGQALFIVTAKFYNIITPFDIHEHIEKDNVAVGFAFSGALIGMANIIGFALSGDFISWYDSFEKLAYSFVFGIVFLPLARIFSDKILLPGRNLTDELVNQEKPNIGAGLIEAFAYIAGSILIVWIV